MMKRKTYGVFVPFVTSLISFITGMYLTIFSINPFWVEMGEKFDFQKLLEFVSSEIKITIILAISLISGIVVVVCSVKNFFQAVRLLKRVEILENKVKSLK